MKTNTNIMDPTKIVTGERIKSTLLMTMPQFINIPGARTRVGVDGVRIDVPELAPLLLMKREVPYLFFFKKTVYEINHDCLFSKLTKMEFDVAMSTCVAAVEGIKNNTKK